MDSSIQSALITGGSVIVVLIADRLLFSKLSDSKKRKRDAKNTYRAYANPMVNAGQSLLWRLKEILNCDGRCEFLCSSSPKTEFVEYKRTSTYYRLGAMLAWIQAYNRELSYLPVQSNRKLRKFQNAIDSIKDTLASGLHIERQRVENLALLYGMNLPSEKASLDRMCTGVESVLRHSLHEHDCKSVKQLSEKARMQLAIKIVTIMDQAKLSEARETEIEKKLDETIDAIAFREAWIYRDYQTSIGDLMLVDTSNPRRRFDVIGYGDFEEMINNTQERSSGKYISKLIEVFEDIGVASDEGRDARESQLRNLLGAVSELLQVMVDIDSGCKAILTTLTLSMLKDYASEKKSKKGLLWR
jgi:hypothetical protein